MIETAKWRTAMIAIDVRTGRMAMIASVSTIPLLGRNWKLSNQLDIQLPIALLPRKMIWTWQNK